MMLSIFVLIILGVITAYFAKQRGRDPIIWFFVGALFGLLGLLLLFILPSAANSAEPGAADIEKRAEPEVAMEESLPDPFNKEWYYLDNLHVQQGPMGIGSLQSAWENEQITANTYVWHEGLDNWKKVFEIPNLEEKLSKSQVEN